MTEVKQPQIVPDLNVIRGEVHFFVRFLSMSELAKTG